jgi:type VI secretion system protein ImpH
MKTPNRTPDAKPYFSALAAKPYDFDFFQTLRHIECLFPDQPRLGQALRPADEPLRLGQEPSMIFAPATLSAFKLPEDKKPARMEVRFLGMLGPNGPLPLHLTEYARDRLMHVGDATFARFLDIFNHRFLTLFYRAWAQAQPAASLDRPQDDRFALYVGAAFGLGQSAVRNRDPVADAAKLFHAGILSRQVRNRDGLAALLTGYFRMPVRVEEFVGHRMTLPQRDQSRLGSANSGAALGVGTVLGSRVWDRQHKFRLWLGPLTLQQYQSFLPGGSAIEKLVAWVRQYLCFELDWDARLVITKEQVPKTRLGQFGQLGWTSWLGGNAATADAADLTLDVERVIARSRRASARHKP